ncbi:uncharacterized protein LOC119579974 [Penaeus monodon]|uniref:uncharacterized protein LOC119579974 n=1 Tax=Penaeus monodon TaxID=6687 RepID=UPI0018A764BD|nr:uncharacterized protein LOC119579974 [Penaeus monodon]
MDAADLQPQPSKGSAKYVIRCPEETPGRTSHTGSVLQCSAACQSRGSACGAFVTRRTAGGVLCELIGAVQSCSAAPGVHTYCSKAAMAQGASLGYVGVGNGQYYKFVTGGGNSWQESVTECDLIFGSLFAPASFAEFEAVRAHREQNGPGGTLWVGLRYDVNYPEDIHGIETHTRVDGQFCASMVDTKDHIDYEVCGDGFDGKICKLDPRFV